MRSICVDSRSCAAKRLSKNQRIDFAWSGVLNPLEVKLSIPPLPNPSPAGRVSPKATPDAVQGWTAIFNGCKPLKMKESGHRYFPILQSQSPGMGFCGILTRKRGALGRSQPGRTATDLDRAAWLEFLDSLSDDPNQSAVAAVRGKCHPTNPRLTLAARTLTEAPIRGIALPAHSKGDRGPTSHLLCVLCGSTSPTRCFRSSYRVRCADRLYVAAR